MAKYIVEGITRRGGERKFHIEVEANSDKHAREMAVVQLGAKTEARKGEISITAVKQQGK